MDVSKEEFFRNLYSLDDDTTDEEDRGRAESMRLLSDSKQHKAQGDTRRRSSADKPSPKAGAGQPSPGFAKQHSPQSAPHAPRRRSAPNLDTSPRASNNMAFTKTSGAPKGPVQVESTDGPTSIANLRQYAVVPRPVSRGKAKKAASIKLAPQARRILDGLIFYFFPNNDIHVGRRMKIAKALEYGGIWLDQWRDGITHVVLDNSMNYDQLVRFLKIDAISDNVAVVNEEYIPDCLIFRSVLDPRQSRYMPKGYKPILAQQIKPALLLPALPQVPPASSQPIEPLGCESDQEDVIPETQCLVEGGKIDMSSIVHGAEDCTTVQYEDDLAKAIGEAKAVSHLPLDSEEDQEAPSSEIGSGTDDESQQPAKRRKLSTEKTWQNGFQCMQKNDGKSQTENPNGRIIEVLQEMSQYYDQIQDQWRSIAYRKAIASLKKHPTKITTKEEASRIPFVGDRLAAKIEEIVYTNTLRRLDSVRSDPTDKVLQKFLKIYGVGLAQATRWSNQGYKSLQDLLDNVNLTPNQRIGIAHYDDFQTRIPRAEVEKHGEYVRRALQKIDPDVQVTIGGSYRRGAADSGDIDLIITKPDVAPTYLRSVIMDMLIPKLFSDGFLQAGLAVTHKDDGSKWHGASMLLGSSTWRRIDFLMVPWEEMGAALIYFTGNDIFNRSIRLLASKKGMRLNQRGLFDNVSRGRNREKLNEGTLLESKSERRIFEILGVPYRPPHHRIC